jgi:uracil phosphoribosyltransferase
MSPSSSTLYVSSHPIVATKLSVLRDKTSSSKVVRDVMNNLAILLGYEATQDLELNTTKTVSSMDLFGGYIISGTSFQILTTLVFTQNCFLVREPVAVLRGQGA